MFLVSLGVLIFLDIDGVMVPVAGWKPSENLEDGFPMFSKKATEALQGLISYKTDVVLSTSHRDRFSIPEWKQIFERRGIKIENLGRLDPNENFAKKRKDEILGWLNSHSVSDGFVIIDDDKTLNALPASIKQRLILTSSMIGLTAEHVAQVQALD
jgi:hypothetical protein